MQQLPSCTEEVAVTDARGFFLTNCLGDIESRARHGLFRSDIRFLSRFRLTLGGSRPVPVSIRTRNGQAVIRSTNRALPGIPAGTIGLRRERSLDGDLKERISVTNLGAEPVEAPIRIELGADFAHVFQVRDTGIRRRPRRPVPVEGWDHAFACGREAGEYLTLARWSTPGCLDANSATFTPVLQPGGTWQVELLVSMFENEQLLSKRADADGPRPGWQQAGSSGPVSRSLRRVRAKALADLALLTLELPTGELVVGAGIPYFMTLFGRDSLMTAYLCLNELPDLAPQVLRALARRQGTGDNAVRDEEPGKIPHEVRQGAAPGKDYIPFPCYYGSVDATPLFLILLSEHFRRSGDRSLLDELWPAAEAALGWIDRHGDLDGDGFVEYQRRAPAGLDNQGWKDSWDSVAFRGGALARGPIALCEVQGYVYDAKRRMAELYHLRGAPEAAGELERQAHALQEHFEAAFWMPEEGTYAMALDGRKRQVDAVSSNPGHCLWSGIVSPERAGSVVGRLMSEDIFSGWGLRTLSTRMRRYDPLAYHNGSVWPHDTVLAASGMMRYGYREEAARLLNGLLGAARAWPGFRLPELFGGGPRQPKLPPVPYPEACTPQAWGAAAAIHALYLLSAPEGAEESEAA